nr:MAG TPA: hypothetical protein [Caudoviricetes sp.]
MLFSIDSTIDVEFIIETFWKLTTAKPAYLLGFRCW